MDTNVLLDLELPERPRNQLAEALFAAAEDDYVQLCACTAAYKDVDYIVRACLKREGWGPLEAKSRAFECARNAFDSVVTLPLTGAMTELGFGYAASGSEQNLEDALVRACAEVAGVDAIVSSDARAFKDASVPAVSLEEALRLAFEE
ncbi:hypothetical protein QJ041_08985 [Olsenella sp. YH-ols2216]|nr:hypothetical protein [Olsenella sp. YH-ols2216]